MADPIPIRDRGISRVLIAESFLAPCAHLSEVSLPLDILAKHETARLRLVVLASEGAYRVATLGSPRFSTRESLRLLFAPFDNEAGARFVIGALDVSGSDCEIGEDLATIRAAAADRPPIQLSCASAAGGALLVNERLEERSIAALLIAEPAPASATPPEPKIRTAYWLDAFWCDSHGIYLRGWAHAYEHRVHALRVTSGGRSVTFTAFADRPDLLAHYPDHEHVRHAGFAVYLPCPPRGSATLTLETDAGAAEIDVPLPEGRVPAWDEGLDWDDEITPILRRFASLANERGGLVLQIGSRTPAGVEPSPPRHVLRGRVIGVDIHPGLYVDIVGDAHGLSRFVRARSVDAVMSASVLEHLEAPWVLAAEINRVLKPGGVVYQQVPCAWPAHAQPNDFWRMSAEGLRVLFGKATGFEVLESADSGLAAIVPGTKWRTRYLDMPTVPAFMMAEIVARKVEEIEPGAVAWPLASDAGETRARQYPVAGLRPGGDPP